MKRTILVWYLRVLALIQIGLWGLSHLFYPEWYMTAIAGKDPAMLTTFNILLVNEIGAMVLAVGLITFLASFNPEKHLTIIIMIVLMSLGSIGVTFYHIVIRQASQEWGHIITVIVQLGIVVYLYPWKRGAAYLKAGADYEK